MFVASDSVKRSPVSCSLTLARYVHCALVQVTNTLPACADRTEIPFKATLSIQRQQTHLQSLDPVYSFACCTQAMNTRDFGPCGLCSTQTAPVRNDTTPAPPDRVRTRRQRVTPLQTRETYSSALPGTECRESNADSSPSLLTRGAAQ